MVEDIDFKACGENLKDFGYTGMPDKVFFGIKYAEQLLRRGLEYFCGTYLWLKEYNEIVDWLSYNQGRGLLINGGPGLGKTVIGKKIIPILINHECRKVMYVYHAQDLTMRPSEIFAKHIIMLDDIGTEGIKNEYGTKRIPFSELCDMAEESGKLLVITTNLDVDSMLERYGDRTVDRLRGITKLVTIKGNSLRR